tara:strand:+ start:222 stop:365 length:144 start_codon:yes stop_codon:yes gene_type:complete
MWIITSEKSDILHFKTKEEADVIMDFFLENKIKVKLRQIVRWDEKAL